MTEECLAEIRSVNAWSRVPYDAAIAQKLIDELLVEVCGLRAELKRLQDVAGALTGRGVEWPP